jgi:hypothetical protein
MPVGLGAMRVRTVVMGVQASMPVAQHAGVSPAVQALNL